MSERSHDIEKYLRGELTSAEMHALEKRALDDPFLADALEGASQIHENDFAIDIHSLNKALTERVDKKKVVPLWVWTARIAAGLLLVAISTVFIINLTKNSKKEELALIQKKNAETIKDSQAGDVPTTSRLPDSTSSASTNALALNGNDQNKNEAIASAAPNQEVKPKSFAIPEKPAEQTDVLALREEQPKQDTARLRFTLADAYKTTTVETEKAEVIESSDDRVLAKESGESKRKAKGLSVSPPAVVEGVAAQRSSDAAPSATYGYSTNDKTDNSSLIKITKVTGRVTSSDDGTGLPGVNVVIKGTSTGTVTDIEGNYLIEVPDPYVTLVYSFIGLESTEIPVNNSIAVNVTMEQDVAQLSEVVVTGFGEKEAPAFSTFEMAEPRGGRRAFKKYLEDKLIYPQQALANNVEGKVTIQFTVESTGKLSNFNIIKGIGYGCDEEVIRLIKQGPKWSATKRNDEPVKGRVRVRLRFTLPKKK